MDELVLPPHLHTHNVFHVSLCKQYIPDPLHVFNNDDTILVTQEEEEEIVPKDDARSPGAKEGLPC